MTSSCPTVARSPRRLRRELLASNRFFGLHQMLLAAALSPLMMGGVAHVMEQPWQVWWAMPAFFAAWGAVELCFLPRRLAIHRLAQLESDAEIRRVAIRTGVAMKAVTVLD